MQERRPSAFPVLLLMGGMFLVYRNLGPLLASWTGRTPDGLRLAMILGQALGLGGICLPFLLLDGPWRRLGIGGRAGFRPPAPALLLLCLLLAAGLFVPLWASDALRARLVGDPQKEKDILALLTPGSGGRAWIFLALAVTPALFEEMAFRGLLQPALEASWGAVAGLLSASFLFAAFHWSPAQTVVQFVLGLALGWMRQRTGSLWPSVLGHALHNGIAVAAMAARPDLFGEHPALPPLPWVAAGLLLATLSARALKRRTEAR